MSQEFKQKLLVDYEKCFPFNSNFETKNLIHLQLPIYNNVLINVYNFTDLYVLKSWTFISVWQSVIQLF